MGEVKPIFHMVGFLSKTKMSVKDSLMMEAHELDV